uniref:Protein unc-93 homolog A n=1 Tax=Anolis carolinensis TaxID=28377 RepID=L7MZV9_ANOCA
MEKHLKNILVVSFGFFFLFTAYGGLQNLQSSLHSVKGLGVTSVSVIYAALILSAMFLPPIIIQKLGCKWTIVGSMCCYITYTLGNFYASWYMLIPTSMILGLAGAPLWSAKCTYLTIAGNSYAEKAGKLGRDVVNQYFGTFFLIFQSSGICGNLISSVVSGQTPKEMNISEAELECCGAADCRNMTTYDADISRPTETLIYTLLGIYTGSGVLAVLLVAVFLDPISGHQNETEEKKISSFWTTILSTFRHHKDIRQCLLIPLTFYSGLEQGFLSSDYTRAYVTCALGINFVGYVMICFAAANSIFSIFFGKISQFTGRNFLFVLALYGVLFEKHKEAAFANYRLWESLGFVIAFGYSTFLRVYVKLYIVLAVLVVSMVLYETVEYLESKNSLGTASPARQKPAESLQNDQETQL